MGEIPFNPANNAPKAGTEAQAVPGSLGTARATLHSSIKRAEHDLASETNQVHQRALRHERDNLLVQQLIFEDRFTPGINPQADAARMHESAGQAALHVQALIEEIRQSGSARYGLNTASGEVTLPSGVIQAQAEQLIELLRQTHSGQAKQAQPQDGSPKTAHKAEETPQPDKKASSAENETTEETLEQKAERLAALTRQEGMGLLEGKFPHGGNRGGDGGFQSRFGFIQGLDKSAAGIYADKRFSDELFRLVSRIVDRDRLPKHIYDAYDKTDTFVWASAAYQQKTQQYEVKKGFRKEIVSEPLTVEGKTGPQTGVAYNFFMPIPSYYDSARRNGTFMELFVVVPEHIAREIDSIDLTQHPDFPDKYLHALFPGLFGPDKDTQVVRMPATHLYTHDFRKSPDINAGQFIPFPQPISH